MGPLASSRVITVFHCLLATCENLTEITQKLQNQSYLPMLFWAPQPAHNSHSQTGSQDHCKWTGLTLPCPASSGCYMTRCWPLLWNSGKVLCIYVACLPCFGHGHHGFFMSGKLNISFTSHSSIRANLNVDSHRVEQGEVVNIILCGSPLIWTQCPVVLWTVNSSSLYLWSYILERQ